MNTLALHEATHSNLTWNCNDKVHFHYEMPQLGLSCILEHGTRVIPEESQDLLVHWDQAKGRTANPPLCSGQQRASCWFTPAYLGDQTPAGLTERRAQDVADWEEEWFPLQPCLATYFYRVSCCSLPGMTISFNPLRQDPRCCLHGSITQQFLPQLCSTSQLSVKATKQQYSVILNNKWSVVFKKEAKGRKQERGLHIAYSINAYYWLRVDHASKDP